MADESTYLTETILTVQHEVQLALDYIETVAGQETSELGASLSLITVDNLRVRLPIVLEVEHQEHPVETPKETPLPGKRLSFTELAKFKSQLQLRQGLLLKEQKGRLGSFAKVKVSTPPPAASGTPSPGGSAPMVQSLIGEIELNFVRVPREFEAPAPSSGTAGEGGEGGGVGGTPVPDLIGLTLDESITQLNAAGWKFEPHAAADAEIAAAPRERRGRVLRQDPAADRLVEKSAVTLHFWVALSNLPVTELDGIGAKTGERLAGLGLASVGQLSLVKAADLSAGLRISQPRAQAFIDMAALMARLLLLDLRDEVVELLVKGAGVRSIEELAGASAGQLYEACQKAVAGGRLQTPRSFKFTRDDVAGWIKTARSYLGR